MGDIIEFPPIKNCREIYTEGLIAVLNTLPGDVRTIIESQIDSICQKYSAMFEPSDISLPANATEEQEAKIRSVISGKNQMIQDLVMNLISANIKHELVLKSKS